MGFGPKEFPDGGIRQPRGDRASTTGATSAGFLDTTSRCLSESGSNSINNRNSVSLCSTIQGSFRATRSHGLFPRQESHPSSTQELCNTNDELPLRSSTMRSTTDVLIAAISRKDHQSSRAGKVPDMISVDLGGSNGDDNPSAASTLQGSFRVTRSQGLPLKQPRPSSKHSTAGSWSTPLRDTDANTAALEGNSTVKGSFRATKSQGLRSKCRGLGSTDQQTKLSCPSSAAETADSRLVARSHRQHKTSQGAGHSRREEHCDSPQSTGRSSVDFLPGHCW